MIAEARHDQDFDPSHGCYVVGILNLLIGVVGTKTVVCSILVKTRNDIYGLLDEDGNKAA